MLHSHIQRAEDSRRSHGPHSKLTMVAEESQSLAIAAEAQGVAALGAQDRLTGLRVPDSCGAVPPVAHEQVSAWAEREPRYVGGRLVKDLVTPGARIAKINLIGV